MKYTVVIRQPVSDEVRPVLEGHLVERFGLSPEQAQRLAGRRSGRLMKPTGRARADLLLRLYQDVGAQVALEEVREETGVFAEPFGAAEPGLGGLGLSPLPEEGGTFGAPSSRQGGGGADAFAAAAVRDEPGVLTLPPREEGGWPGLAADTFAPLGGVDDPLAASSVIVGRPTEPAPVGVSAGEPLPLAGNPAPAGGDSWSDFTGALTLPDAGPREEPVAAAPEAFLTAAPEENRGPLGRRRSLARQMAFGALAPLVLSTAVTLGLLTAVLPSLQRQLVAQNAEAVAVAVGTSLDTRDQETVNTQLDALLRRSSVGFVRVELPDGTTYFRSQNPGLDGTLQGRVATFLRDNPETGTFVNRGSAADAYREQLKELETVGAGGSAQARQLRDLAGRKENQRSERVSYVISRLGVLETRNGGRTTTDASRDSGDLLYRIAVGVPNTEAAANLRNTLWLVLAVSLLALLLAASLAVRSARRVVQPIEQLVRLADAISMGDLSRRVQPGRNDEIGDLAQALERMRLSLEAAMERLRRRKRA